MLKRKFDQFDAIMFEDNNSIHMFFMSYPLDVIFIDGDNTVVSVRKGVKPWRMAMDMKAITTIEVPAGVIEHSKTEAGDKLEYQADLTY